MGCQGKQLFAALMHVKNRTKSAQPSIVAASTPKFPVFIIPPAAFNRTFRY
jgi:hypothetical protein